MANDSTENGATIKLTVQVDAESITLLAESLKSVAQAMYTVTTGLGGVAEVFNNTLGPAMRDFDANYTKAMDGYLSGVERLAAELNAKLSLIAPDVNAGIASSAASVAEEAYGCCRCCAATGSLPGRGNALEGASVATKQSVAPGAVANDKDNDVAAYARSWSAKAAIAGSAVGEISSSLQNLYKATGSKNRAMFEAMKGFAIAETVIQTARGAMGAYAALSSIKMVGPALGATAAGAVIAAGAARVAMIKSSQPGDVGVGMSTGGSINPSTATGANAYPVNEAEAEPRPMQNVTVVIHNPLSQQNWAELVEREVIPAINDAAENRNVRLSVETA